MESREPGTDDFESMMSKDRGLIEKRLDELMPRTDEPPVSLHEAMRYAVIGGGKRIRGILCLTLHNIFGCPYPDCAMDAACSIELLHSYTLIHDDLPALDDDDKRRGKPSCHVRFGEATAILAGDALQAMAFEVISNCGCQEDRVLESIKILSRAAGSLFLVGGQAADLEYEGKEQTEDRVTFIHRRKTAELIAASMAIGATLGGASNEERTAILGIGRDVGFAFQIVDDLLDVEGSEIVVGKGLRKDETRGKITYPGFAGIGGSRVKAAALIDSAVDRMGKFGGGEYITWLFTSILERAS